MGRDILLTKSVVDDRRSKCNWPCKTWKLFELFLYLIYVNILDLRQFFVTSYGLEIFTDASVLEFELLGFDQKQVALIIRFNVELASKGFFKLFFQCLARALAVRLFWTRLLALTRTEVDDFHGTLLDFFLRGYVLFWAL